MALRSVMLAAAAVIPAMIATLHQGPGPASAHTGCNQPWDRPDGMYIQPQSSAGQYLVIAHELGHVLLLAHDGMNGDSRDWECGGYRVPATLMDYDCMYSVMPTNWDFCGVNHKHPSSYGAAGC